MADDLITHSPGGPAPDAPSGSSRRDDSAIDRWNVRAVGARLGITPRTIQIALGLAWIVDAALQFQPVMWHRGFVTGTILPSAMGQPAPVAWLITNVGHFLLPDIGVWNFLFGTIQLGIGVGLLFRRTVRPALAVSFVWCLAVWWIGEGFGMLLTGTATPLSGAPGAVVIYAAIGLLVWPRRTAAERLDSATVEPPVGVASSAAARGPLGSFGPLALWSTFWVGSAVLWLLPANRAGNALSTGISRAASGEPGWYAHFLTTFAGHFAGIGTQGAWVLAIVSLVIGIGPLLVSRPTAFLAAGAVLQIVLWVAGMAMGALLTGTSTDPNLSPLIVVLAFAMLPTLVPVRASVRTPIAGMLRWNRATTWGIGAGVAATLLLSATYPVAAGVASASGTAAHVTVASTSSSSSSSSISGGSAMSGMSTGSGSNGTTGAHAGTAMNMEAAAGLNVVDPHWSYAGPALPAGEVSLLNSVGAITDEGHAMQTPNCATKATSQQVLGAMEYVQSTSNAVAKYKELSEAVAAGYVPVTSPAYPVVHYVNPAYLNTKYTMDPNHVQSLVYAFTPYGPVLVAAMYLMPTVSAKGPMPYGCLVQWHAHTNLCYSLATHEIVGFTPCAPGTVHERTAVMTHVWQVPVPGGPLALDPSDVQTVEAAIQAQQDGMAPTTNPLPTLATSATVGVF
jgi:hypothetical protein